MFISVHPARAGSPAQALTSSTDAKAVMSTNLHEASDWNSNETDARATAEDLIDTAAHLAAVPTTASAGIVASIDQDVDHLPTLSVNSSSDLSALRTTPAMQALTRTAGSTAVQLLLSGDVMADLDEQFQQGPFAAHGIVTVANRAAAPAAAIAITIVQPTASAQATSASTTQRGPSFVSLAEKHLAKGLPTKSHKNLPIPPPAPSNFSAGDYLQPKYNELSSAFKKKCRDDDYGSELFGRKGTKFAFNYFLRTNQMRFGHRGTHAGTGVAHVYLIPRKGDRKSVV